MCPRKTTAEQVSLANSRWAVDHQLHFNPNNHHQCFTTTTGRHHYLRSIKIVDLLLNSSTEEGAVFTDRHEGADHPCPCNEAGHRFAEADEVGRRRREVAEVAAAATGTEEDGVVEAVAVAEEAVATGELNIYDIVISQNKNEEKTFFLKSH